MPGKSRQQNSLKMFTGVVSSVWKEALSPSHEDSATPFDTTLELNVELTESFALHTSHLGECGSAT